MNIKLGVLLGVVILANPVLGQDLDGTLKKIKTTGTFAIGYRDSAPPFSFMGPDKRPVGYSIDLCMNVASAIEKQLGIANLKLNWVPVTAENRVDMVAQGKVDIECSTTTATLSRQEKVDFSLMTFVDGGSLMSLADVDMGTGINGLTNKRIAVIPNTTTEKALAEFLKKQFITVQIVRIKDHAEGIAAIEAKKADALASDRGILIGLALTSKDPKRFALANLLFSYEPYGLMVRRNDAAFRLAVNRPLAALFRSGGIVSIYERWFAAFGKPSEAIQAMYLLNGLPE
ncbi:MAG TPA: amino acid ABC transporter substrate-binding protein [Candidatus Acidoferrales bacterium]|nr:amino acid ABC transporter substrate-binding protein [Candidatus Acidoferrales bacterium]